MSDRLYEFFDNLGFGQYASENNFNRLISCLDSGQQDMLKLFVIDGLSYVKISKRYFKNPSVIRGHIKESIKILKSRASKINLSQEPTFREIGINNAVIHSLNTAGVYSISDLNSLTIDELENIKGVGSKSFEILKPYIGATYE